MENINFKNASHPAPMEELTNYHHLLSKQFSDPEVHIPVNPDTEKLIPFNGYYTLNSAKGAFFAIDTNMIVRPGFDPVYDLSLLISLDGTSSSRYAFTGTFDGSNLAQHWDVGGLDIHLTFTRTNSTYGPTVSCSGSITLPGHMPLAVTGNTYNNPIPASLFIGDYYNSIAPHQQVMQIGSNNQLLYDGGIDGGPLQAISNYIYNLNMYYFSFVQGNTTVKLIMGTASAQGFACNNMSVTDGKLVSRSLLTIPNGSTPSEFPYIENNQLPDFSGYYQIPLPGAPLAFLSIQAQYITLSEKADWDLYFVMISYSLDGRTSTGYFLDFLKGMSFDNTTHTLTVPASSGQAPLTLTFTRQYNPATGSLVNVSGTINGTTINGSTLFNPVPLSVFGGVPLTNSSGDKLVINDDNSITYNATVYDSIIYVPLMYIVAAPIQNPNLVLSLGTDGLRGSACIVITYPSTKSQTTAVYAINGPE